jgi:hypothetical protein
MAVLQTGWPDSLHDGVLASLVQPLAEAGISVFALSTFDTDYLLVKAAHLTRAIDTLRQQGHVVG